MHIPAPIACWPSRLGSIGRHPVGLRSPGLWWLSGFLQPARPVARFGLERALLLTCSSRHSPKALATRCRTPLALLWCLRRPDLCGSAPPWATAGESRHHGCSDTDPHPACLCSSFTRRSCSFVLCNPSPKLCCPERLSLLDD